MLPAVLVNIRGFLSILPTSLLLLSDCSVDNVRAWRSGLEAILELLCRDQQQMLMTLPMLQSVLTEHCSTAPYQQQLLLAQWCAIASATSLLIKNTNSLDSTVVLPLLLIPASYVATPSSRRSVSNLPVRCVCVRARARL
jgi:hypothetical protein